MAASAAEVAAVDKAIREVRAQYARAKVKVEANTSGWFQPPEAASIKKAFLDVGGLLEKWASTYRTWAVNGRRDDGTAYDVQRFLDFGRKDVADAVERIAGEAYDRSLFAAVKAAASETAKDLNPANWSATAKVAAVLLALVVVAVAAAMTTRDIRKLVAQQ
ncbi:hypothetical protein [Archangium violaceum]|uniref:hypothetical protein n=1 Tax=Archangium violaceum TaxID=83451 RepID=UPI0036DC6623